MMMGHGVLGPSCLRFRVPFVIAGLDPAIHHSRMILFLKIDGYAGQARV
jgi:hypothetical protein